MNNCIKSLYIHIPFCTSICHYCDFAKLQYFHNFVDPYLNSLQKEINFRKVNEDLETIYVGGGTPTCLELNELEKLLKILKPYTKKVKEYTFEANPETLNEEKLVLLKKYGVNRLSIGVESTNDDILKNINRKHTYNDVVNIVKLARKVGFDNINVDLIIGLPNVTKKMLIKDIDNILLLDVNHISAYSLTVHQNTIFFMNNIKQLDDDLIRDYYDIVNEKLKKNGFIHYEVSNWSKPQKMSLHNLTYWKDNQYYGIGLNASGYVNNFRYTNTRSINEYNNNIYNKEKEYISIKEDEEYYIMLNLRTIYGISFLDYKKRFSKDFLDTYKKIITKYTNLNILKIENDHLIPTYQAMMTLDEILLDFFTFIN